MRGLILTYHRVAEAEVDPWSLCVSPERFSDHLDVLREVASPCTLGELIRAHAAGNVPENAVAVTFDDGYLDNLTNAKPILEAHDVPATVFVCSGAIGQNEEFWWDQLGRAFLLSNELPEWLVIEIAGKRFEWNFGQASDGKKRVDNCVAVWKALRPFPTAMLKECMRQIRAWAGISDEALQTTLSVRELGILASSPLVDIGAHTVSHPLLTAHSAEVQHWEITHSRSQLEQIINRPVQHFAYPYGEYDASAVNILRDARFLCACTTVGQAVTWRSKAFELPRVTIDNCSSDKFAEIITRKLDDSDVVSRGLDVGDEIVFPLKSFMSKTGEERSGVLECIPKKHTPGHCLYGPNYFIADDGMYRAAFVLRHGEPLEVISDTVCDVYENRRVNRVLMEAPLGASATEYETALLEFVAKRGYSIELRVYWRGKRNLNVMEVRLKRLA
jgi:peptidoglycan/xylan/chitin deacetylase (PgdA/CDA1 family)